MKKLLALLLALTMVFALSACAQPAGTSADSATGDSTDGSSAALNSFTVTVVHADGTSKDFTYEADAAMLGAFLEKEGLIIGSGDGMFHTVDGEKADWNVNQSYWAFYVEGNYAVKGIYDTAIENGKHYKLEYTLG